MSSSVPSLSSAGYSVSNETPEFGRKYQILERHQADYAQRFLDRLFGWQGVGLIIAGYVADGKIMDREGWEFYFGADIGPETDEIKEALKFSRFYKFYHGPNPVDVMENKPVDLVRRICETSLIPTIVPKKVRATISVIGINLELEWDFNLQVLGELAEHPENGHAAKYAYASQALRQHGTNGVNQSHLASLLEGVVARNQCWENQVQYLKDLKTHTGYECEAEPDVCSQNTVLIVHHAVTGKRPFGDHSGIEGRWTYGRTVELVDNTYHIVSGGFSAGPVGPLGGSALAELRVGDYRFGLESDGVGVLRKFKAIGTRNIGTWI